MRITGKVEAPQAEATYKDAIGFDPDFIDGDDF
jgi:hypothetical protein